MRTSCTEICDPVERMLPSMEAGRIDHDDLERIYWGIVTTHAILDNVHLLTARQQLVVELYYREGRLQREIAAILSITQQAVHDALMRAKKTIGEKLKRHTFV